MHNFRDLKVWQKAIDLAVDVYKAMSSFPLDERYGLVSQMKRCSISIPSNIAEGSERNDLVSKTTEIEKMVYSLTHRLEKS